MSTLLLLLDSEIEIYVCSDNRWVVKWWTLWDTYLALEESTKSWSKAVSVVWNVMAVTAIVLSWSLVTKLTEGEKVGGSLRRSSPILWKKALTTSSSLSSLARGWTFFLMRWNRVTPHTMDTQHLCNSGLKHPRGPRGPRGPRKLQDAMPSVAWLLIRFMYDSWERLTDRRMATALNKVS